MGFKFNKEEPVKEVQEEVIPERLSPLLIEKMEKSKQEEELFSARISLAVGEIEPLAVMVDGKEVTVSPDEQMMWKEEAANLAVPFFALINDPKIRYFAAQMWEKAPMYFFVIGASATGKHHAPWSVQKGGLVRHVLMGMQVAYDLSRTFGLNDHETDMAIAAMAGHDCLKYGDEFKLSMLDMHPYLPRSYYGNKRSKGYIASPGIDKDTFDTIMTAIERHMGSLHSGEWTSVSGIKPETPIQQVVHLADYMSSRKKIVMDDFIEIV